MTARFPIQGNLAAWLTLAVLAQGAGHAETTPAAERIAFHDARYDAQGRLEPWKPWPELLKLEMEWYLNCPAGQKGYPVYFYTTFMDDLYVPYKTDFIPSTQLGMGIISYVKYWNYIGHSDDRVLKQAVAMGDFLLQECLTADEGKYPRFPRSTGEHTALPIQTSSQGDIKYGPNIIQPDKGAIAGYAFLVLHQTTGEQRFLDAAIHIAEILAQNMRPADASHAPWPFRVDAVTGQYWGERNGNMAYILRLFDGLLARGLTQFQPQRDTLWQWIKTTQIPAPNDRATSLWIQFFEDMTEEDNRNSWSPLEMARYLIERREALDPAWKELAGQCIDFAMRNFSLEEKGGVTLMGEQDSDKRPWGGACSKLGGVAALYYAAGGGEQWREIARRNLNWVTYFVDNDGGPAAMCSRTEWKKGSWQEDCHTDVVLNFVDALVAVPELAQ